MIILRKYYVKINKKYTTLIFEGRKKIDVTIGNVKVFNIVSATIIRKEFYMVTKTKIFILLISAICIIYLLFRFNLYQIYIIKQLLNIFLYRFNIKIIDSIIDKYYFTFDYSYRPRHLKK